VRNGQKRERHPWKSREEPHCIAMASFEVCGDDGWGGEKKRVEFVLVI